MSRFIAASPTPSSEYNRISVLLLVYACFMIIDIGITGILKMSICNQKGFPA